MKKIKSSYFTEQREKFKFRKSKKYKNLCSLAVTTLAVAGLATTTAQADENTVSTTPATNLVSVQPASSEEHAETQAQANTETGVIVEEIPSKVLEEAVAEAIQSGVSVTEDTAVVKENIELAKEDLEAQVNKVQEASETQKTVIADLADAVSEAEKAGVEIIDNSSVSYKDENGAALTDVAKQVGQIEAATKTQIELDSSLRQASETAKEAGVQISLESESKHREVTEALQDMAEQVGKLNEATTVKKQIDQLLTEIRSEATNSGVEISESEAVVYNNLAEALKDAEVQLDKLKLAVSKQDELKSKIQDIISNAEKSGTEVVKSGLITGSVTSVSTKMADEIAKANEILSRNAETSLENKQKEEEYATKLANYNQRIESIKAQIEADKKKAEELTKVEGNLSKVVEATYYWDQYNNVVVESVTGQGKLLTEQDYRLIGSFSDSDRIDTFKSLIQGTNLSDYKNVKTTNGDGYSTLSVMLNDGESFSVRWSGEFTSSQTEADFDEIEITYRLDKTDLGYGVVTVYNDGEKAKGNPEIIYFASKDTNSSSGLEATLSYKFYSNGKEIVVNEDNAVLVYLASMNRGIGYTVDTKEYVVLPDGAEFIGITGSTITNHDGVLYSDVNNNFTNPSETSSPARFPSAGDTDGNIWYGSAAARYTGPVSFKVGTTEGNYAFTSHAADNTFVVDQRGGNLPPRPESPTTSPLTPINLSDYKITESIHGIGITSTVHDVTMVVDKHDVKIETSIHPVLVSQKPSVTKEVTNLAMVNIDGQTIPKGSIVTFKVTADNLLAGREETTGFKYIDPFAGGLEILKEETVAANAGGHFTLAVNENGVYELIGTKATENLLNSNRMTADVTPPSGYFVARVTNDGATYSNTAPVIITTPSGEYKAVSNTVTVSTPDPANPQKAAKNNEGVVINGKPVVVGSTIFYTITLDYDQYANLTADDSIIKAGFGAFDDYPEDALTVDLEGATFSTLSGKAVTGLTVKDNSSVSVADDVTKQLLSSSQIGGKVSGAFISVIADDPISYYNDIVKKNEKVVVTIPMTVKTELYNTGKSFENTAYQVDFGHGYVTNTVTNTTPVVTPTKNNTNSQGVLINGKYVLANSVNYYKVNLDYSNYKGIEADTDFISQGFYAVDDYPEEALTVDAAGIQLFTSDNKLVNGMTSKVYESLLQAPAALQHAMAKQGFATKGAVLVLSADDPQAFYEAYVKTGKQLTAVLPMTVKAELGKTGGRYENTAYQVDFGTAYVTNTVVNNVPKIDPKKDVVLDLTNQKDSLNGKDIEIGSFLTYKLVGSDIPSDRGTELFSYFWEDDYDETKDQYEGVYKVYADTDITLKDGTKLIGGDGLQTELTRFVIQEVDYTTGKVHTKFDESFLKSISDDSAFKATLYLQMKRIASGDAYNTATHGMNDARVDTNTVVTHTPVGSVLVNYLEDGTGKVLKSQVVDEKEVPTGTAYDTNDQELSQIVTEDGKTYELIRVDGKEVGKVVKGDTIVDYIYKEVKGTVTVHYVDDKGNVIKTPVVDTPETSTGTDYDTTDNKPKTITTEDGKTFELVPDKTKGAETGKVVKGDTPITYVYTEAKGTVTVHYVDENGNIIKTPVVDTPETSTGTDYDTTDNKPKTITTEDGKTFELVPDKTKGAETGKVVKGDTPITYVYTEAKGTVTVHYVDENGNIIKTPVVDTPETSTGTDYDTTDNKPKTITTEDGKTFELVPDKTKGAETGKVVKGDTSITYVYREVKPDAPTPKVEEKGKVTVHYIDENGNVIKTPVVDTPESPVGTDYDTTDNKPKIITTADGKTYELVPDKTKGSETGKVVKGDTPVTYVYKEIKGTVTVHYVDENGNVIKTPVVDTPESPVGTDYDTTDNKPKIITTADGKTYELVPDKTKGAETGKVVKGDTSITYVYREVNPQVSETKVVPPVTNNTPVPPAQPATVAPQLPKTGEVSSAALFVLGLGSMTAATGLAVQKYRKEEQ